MAKGTLSRITVGRKPKKRPVGKMGNQWHADPRQQKFLALYVDPKSKTFANAKQSALAVGFSLEYAENLMSQMPAWLSDSLGDLGMVQKAERNLNEYLELPSKTQAMGPFGPLWDKKKKGDKKRKPIMVFSQGLLQRKWDATEFALERLDKKKYGSKESAKDPVPLQTLIIINAPNGETHRVHTVGETVGSVAIVGRPKND